MDQLHLTFHVNNKQNPQNKMDGIISLNFLGPVAESRCIFKSKCPGSVCSKCYSLKMTRAYKNLKQKMRENYAATLTWNGEQSELPFLNAAFIRISAFGELEDIRHFHFLNSLFKKNPHCQFTMWTKEKDIVAEYYQNNKKPNNLILIYSSYMINAPESLPAYFDKVFTAYFKDYVEKNNVKINCGARQCATCKLCYSKNKVVYINEFEKNEASAQKRIENRMKS